MMEFALHWAAFWECMGRGFVLGTHLVLLFRCSGLAIEGRV